MWMAAAVLCRGTDDRVSLAAWEKYHHQPDGDNAATNRAAIMSSGLHSKVDTIAYLDSLPPLFWMTLWRYSTADIVKDLSKAPNIKHKTIACMIMYGMKVRACLACSRTHANSSMCLRENRGLASSSTETFTGPPANFSDSRKVPAPRCSSGGSW